MPKHNLTEKRADNVNLIVCRAGVLRMKVRTVVLLAFLTALWIIGLIGQLHSAEAAMRYLALSLAIVAFALWRMPVKPALRRRFRDRKRPPDRD